MRSAGRKYWILAIVSIVVLVLDQLTKLAILGRFALGESIPIIGGFFNLTYVRNTGAAFGILAESHPAFRVPFFLAVPVIALLVILFVFRKLPKTDVKLATALSLVMGGALGNLIDRVNHGYVVDFLDFHWAEVYHFPAFNVADSAICIGVGFLMLDLLLQREESLQGGTDASSTR